MSQGFHKTPSPLTDIMLAGYEKSGKEMFCQHKLTEKLSVLSTHLVGGSEQSQGQKPDGGSGWL